MPKHFKENGYLTLGAGELFHAHTFFHERNLSGYSDPTAWVDYFPSKTQQMPAEATRKNGRLAVAIFIAGILTGHLWIFPTKKWLITKVVAWLKNNWPKSTTNQFFSRWEYIDLMYHGMPPKYFDRFPLDQIQLPVHLVNDLEDLPQPAEQRQNVNGTSGLPRHQWKKAVKGIWPRYALPMI